MGTPMPPQYQWYPRTRENLARTMRVRMGNYSGIFLQRVDVVAYWRFDEEGNLFELVIVKHHDVL